MLLKASQNKMFVQTNLSSTSSISSSSKHDHIEHMLGQLMEWTHVRSAPQSNSNLKCSPKFQQISPNFTNFRLFSPNFKKKNQFHPTSSNFTKFTNLPIFAKFRQIHQILSNFVIFHQIMSNFTNFCKIYQFSPHFINFRQIGSRLRSWPNRCSLHEGWIKTEELT